MGIEPGPHDVRGFKKFMERYTAGLAIERAAVEHLKGAYHDQPKTL
jgi:uncharacterized protein YeaO (DUF488 family)